MRADASRNRARILDAARDCFVEQGADVPLETIAARAGVGIATLYRRFPDRQALQQAVALGELCSNDPVCAQHEPDNREEDRLLLGAACHGCLLLPESSCERRNDFLDRSLVVPTVDGNGAAFFDGDDA